MLRYSNECPTTVMIAKLITVMNAPLITVMSVVGFSPTEGISLMRRGRFKESTSIIIKLSLLSLSYIWAEPGNTIMYIYFF